MSNEVHVTEETGDRLVVVRETQLERERDVVVERNIYNERIAMWPEDPMEQRMWALSVMAGGRLLIGPDNLSMLTDCAEQIIEWITNGTQPEER